MKWALVVHQYYNIVSKKVQQTSIRKFEILQSIGTIIKIKVKKQGQSCKPADILLLEYLQVIDDCPCFVYFFIIPTDFFPYICKSEETRDGRLPAIVLMEI